MQNQELECVYVAQGLVLGEAIKAKLQANDIPAMLQFEATGAGFGLTVSYMGEVRVMVPAELADEARDVLIEEPIPDDE